MVTVPAFLKLLKAYFESEISKKSSMYKLMFNIKYHLAKYVPTSIRRFMFRTIHRLYGGQFYGYISGGAPLDPTVGAWFKRIGVRIYQGYGLSETSPVVSMCGKLNQDNIKSVGPILDSYEAKIDGETGELLVKGPSVMKGYYGRDDLTREVLEEDGEPVEEVQHEAHKEENIVVQDFQVLDENGEVRKIKRKFLTKMMFAPYETKEYYNEIKNYLGLYRAKGRQSARCESFRYKGLVAKVALGGKSVKVFLAIDPSFIDENPKYHLKDVSEKKQYAEVPVMMKVRSDRGLKYFKELVDYMFATRGVKPKRNYENVDYLPTLIPNGEAILATLGMSTYYLQNSMNAKGIPDEMPDNLEDYLPMIPGDELPEGEEIEAVVYLDTLCNHFEDGNEVTIDVLKSLHIVTRDNVLRVKARGTLDRKFIIYAEYFDEDALKMIMCTNGTAVRIVRDVE